MIKLIHGDSSKVDIPAIDMIFTDPPFEMSGKDLLKVLNNFDYKHLVLICSMHQALDLYKLSDLDFAFQLVISHMTPTKNRSYQQPHIVHSNVMYFRKHGVKSAFDRRRVQRYDTYSDEKTAYFPSIFHAPKTDLVYKYQKNQNMVNDLIGSFDVESVLDPFAGSGTTLLACLEHKIKNAFMIEKDKEAFQIMKNQSKVLMFGKKIQLEIIE
ncbi:site-specific DNA-methyltransferase [Pasteurella multocida]|uniref:DNA methyltransferase n=1 Tax=Pasteurella multocida TaxID=747 RepID=UPI0020203D92|nr:DNA methyltransferase [Pasteurella multocida]MCL7841685.1 site-specific DNA-methyltransferase [Pasteurella multocida]